MLLYFTYICNMLKILNYPHGVILHYIHYSVFISKMLFSILCTLYSMYIVHCTVCILYIVQYVHCTVCTLYSMYIVQYVHCTYIHVYFSQKQLPREMKSHLAITECAGYIFGSCFCGDYDMYITCKLICDCQDSLILH